ncbi:cystatin-F-like [Narcine bancroftii]|uniref:cystatin-F-like n=1 Tax=Narcine bancroftii TaxID=1343680 RepID=UPI00383116A0
MGAVLEVIFTVFLLFGLAYTDGKSGNITIGPGFPRDINTNDPGVQNAALDAIYSYNNQSNDIYLFKVQRMQKAQVQVVAGLRYFLHVDIGRTFCRKGKPYNFKNCSFQTNPPLIKTLACLFDIWVIPWKQIRHVMTIRCQ